MQVITKFWLDCRSNRILILFCKNTFACKISSSSSLAKVCYHQSSLCAQFPSFQFLNLGYTSNLNLSFRRTFKLKYIEQLDETQYEWKIFFLHFRSFCFKSKGNSSASLCMRFRNENFLKVFCVLPDSSPIAYTFPSQYAQHLAFMFLPVEFRG